MSAVSRFFRNVKSEMSKVTWPTGKELRTYTITVIIAVACMAVFFMVVDFFNRDAYSVYVIILGFFYKECYNAIIEIEPGMLFGFFYFGLFLNLKLNIKRRMTPIWWRSNETNGKKVGMLYTPILAMKIKSKQTLKNVWNQWVCRIKFSVSWFPKKKKQK